MSNTMTPSGIPRECSFCGKLEVEYFVLPADERYGVSNEFAGFCVWSVRDDGDRLGIESKVFATEAEANDALERGTFGREDLTEDEVLRCNAEWLALPHSPFVIELRRDDGTVTRRTRSDCSHVPAVEEV